MKIRSKFQLTEIRQHSWNKNQRTFVFNCVYDQSIPEDKRFLDATPSGHLEVTVNNPAVIAEWELGKYYYFDATPVIDLPAELTEAAPVGAGG